MLLNWFRKRRRGKIDREIEQLNARLEMIQKAQRTNEMRHIRMEELVKRRRKQLFEQALRGKTEAPNRGPM